MSQGSDMKTCNSCLSELPKSAFSKERRAMDGLQGSCKGCQREQWYQRKYGIGVLEYNAMLEEQKGCCAICETHEDTHPRRLSVDHNHYTGEVRALLCGPCNRGIGYLGDTSNMLQKATDYLKRYNS